MPDTNPFPPAELCCMLRTRAGGRLAILGLLLMLFGTSCEKEEQRVTLPPKGSAQVGRVMLGENYTTQVFWDFESNSAVKTSLVEDWDLAFETSPEGYHVWMNGGKGIAFYRTQARAIDEVNRAPVGVPESEWRYDASTGEAQKTYVGDWCNPATRTSKEEVFLLRQANQKLFKLQLLSVSDTDYTIAFASVDAAAPQTYHIPKDPAFNRVYFSAATLSPVQLDPPKAKWDVVFTRYRYIYPGNNGAPDTPYLITGAMLNPFKTEAAKENEIAFEQATTERAQTRSFSAAADAIGGFGWKQYNFSTGRYDVDPKWVYYLRNRNNKLFKLHFLDFYFNGAKGSPSFESERLQ